MHINFKSWFALELANNNKYARAIFAQPKPNPYYMKLECPLRKIKITPFKIDCAEEYFI